MTCQWLGCLALMITAQSSAWAALEPQVQTTRHRTGDVVIASVSVAPPADEAADAAPLIQAAIDEAHAAGGAVVFLPVGRYRLASPLVIREGVTLRGDWAPPSQVKADQTTMLLLTAGRGDAEATPAITMERGTGLREVTLWHPEQEAAAPVPYPWAIAISPTVIGDNMTLSNVTLINPWLGVKIGPEWNELHTLRAVYGTPLSLGVFIDTVTDIGRLDNVDFSGRWWAESGLPGAPANAAALAPTLSQATGVDMGRSDWEFIHRLKVRGYGTGMVVRKGAQGATNAVMYACELTDCGTALRVEELNGIGLAVTGCELTGETGVATTGEFTTVAQFNSSEISSVTHVGRGAVTMQHCRLSGPAVATTGTLSALDCDLVAVSLGADVPRARLLDCRWPAEPLIDNQSRGDVAISQANLRLSRPTIWRHKAAPARRPAKTALVLVTAHGASVDADDNTAAFQAALDAAGQAGGGTVYVPAGRWRLRGGLVVPTGVELRGIFDVPHHTVSDGSTLMALGGRGQEDGTPLISLQPRSGARGLTIWYPEQNLAEPVAYPWAVRGLGVGCWAIDLTMGAAWQGVDFGSHPSDGHVVQYLAGAFLKRALWVSKCSGPGWVEDVQGNPHYAGRLPEGMPQPSYGNDVFARVIAWQRANLEGLVFGDCAQENIRGTFLYAAYDGIAFRSDGGRGPRARVLIHGSDTVSRSCYVQAGNIESHLMQLVPLSDQTVAAWVVEPSFNGRARFDNSQIWAGKTTALVEGSGDFLLSQFNNLTGPLHLRGGKATVVGGYFSGNWDPAVTIEPPCQSAEVVACLAEQALSVQNGIGERAKIRANSASRRQELKGAAAALPPSQFVIRTGWEADQPVSLTDTVSKRGGGLRGISQFTAGPVAGAGRAGGTAYRLAGQVDEPAYAFVYADILSGPIGLTSTSTLSYWLQPENDRSKAAFMDLVFEDGSTLRDSGARTSTGQAARSPGSLYTVGQWAQVVVPLGGQAGKVIDKIMLAFDTRGSTTGPIGALIDDVSITAEAEPPQPAVVTRDGVRMTVTAPLGWKVVHTTDGTNPTAESPAAESVTVAGSHGLNELRWRLQAPDGSLPSRVWTVVW